MHMGHVTQGQRVVLIDDLIATGGTLAAGIKLMTQVRVLCSFAQHILAGTQGAVHLCIKQGPA